MNWIYHWRRFSRAELDLIGRARPTTWSQYLLASTTIKAITRKQPTTLANEMGQNMFVERRRSEKPKFYDNSRRKIGRQALRNRLLFMNTFNFDWLDGLTDDKLRINLKKALMMSNWTTTLKLLIDLLTYLLILLTVYLM